MTLLTGETLCETLSLRGQWSPQQASEPPFVQSAYSMCDPCFSNSIGSRARKASLTPRLSLIGSGTDVHLDIVSAGLSTVLPSVPLMGPFLYKMVMLSP